MMTNVDFARWLAWMAKVSAMTTNKWWSPASPSHSVSAELLHKKELEARYVLTDYLGNLPEGGSTPIVDWDDPADFQTTRPRSILQRLLCGIGIHDWGPVVKCTTSGGFYPIRSCVNGCGKRLLRDGEITS